MVHIAEHIKSLVLTESIGELKGYLKHFLYHVIHCAVYNEKIYVINWLWDSKLITKEIANKVLIFATTKETIQILKKCGADISKSEILHYKKSWHTTEAALSEGADPNLENSEGNTPLHIACYYNSWQSVQLLLERGAKIKLNKKGESCCDFLVRNHQNTDQRLKIIQLM